MPRGYIASTGGTGIAPVAAVPTTAAHFVLWNGEPSGGRTYTITSVSFTPIVSAGAAFVAQLLAHVSASTTPAGTAGFGPEPLDSLASDSRAVALSAVTISNSSIWHPVGTSVNGGAATATIGMGNWQNVRGIYSLRPGGLFSLAVLCSAAGSATCRCFCTWEEG